MKLVNIGFGNTVAAARIVSVVSPESAPLKRLIQENRSGDALIDATYGRRTRAIIFTDSKHMVLSALTPETIANRITGKSGAPDGEEGEEDE